MTYEVAQSPRDEALAAVNTLTAAVSGQQELLDDLAAAVSSSSPGLAVLDADTDLLRRLEAATDRVLPGGPYAAPK